MDPVKSRELVQGFMFNDEALSPLEHFELMQRTLPRVPSTEDLLSANQYREEHIVEGDPDVLRASLLLIEKVHPSLCNVKRSMGYDKFKKMSQPLANLGLDLMQGLHGYTLDQATAESLKSKALLMYEVAVDPSRDTTDEDRGRDDIRDGYIEEYLFFLDAEFAASAQTSSDARTVLSDLHKIIGRHEVKEARKTDANRRILEVLPHTDLPAERKIETALSVLDWYNVRLATETLIGTIDGADEAPRHEETTTKRWLIKRHVQVEAPSEREAAMDILCRGVVEKALHFGLGNPEMFSMISDRLNDDEVNTLRTKIAEKISAAPFYTYEGRSIYMPESLEGVSKLLTPDFVASNPEIAKEIRDKIRDRLKVSTPR